MFKNLKSLFIVTEEDQNNSTQDQSNNNNKTEKQTSNNTQPRNDTGQVNDEILDKLFKAIEDNNQAGFDYLEYRKALKTLASLPMDETVKFQSAFATASTMGVTLENLLASIEFYKKVLQNEEDLFKKTTKEQYATKVELKIKEKGKLTQAIKDKSLQIQKLTEEIRKHQSEMEEIAKFIESADLMIKETTANFDKSIQFLRSQFEQDAAKLKQYIK